MIRFVIEQKMPTLNEYTLACRGNKYSGAKFKKDIENVIGWSIVKARLPKVDKSVTIHFEWHEKTKRRDADNIASAKKFILDALVKQGVLIDDSRRYVTGFTDTIVDDTRDFVVVSIE